MYIDNEMNGVLDHLCMYGVCIEARAGFRAKYSTVDHICDMHGVMSHLLNNGKTLYCGFLDF